MHVCDWYVFIKLHVHFDIACNFVRDTCTYACTHACTHACLYVCIRLYMRFSTKSFRNKVHNQDVTYMAATHANMPTNVGIRLKSRLTPKPAQACSYVYVETIIIKTRLKSRLTSTASICMYVVSTIYKQGSQSGSPRYRPRWQQKRTDSVCFDL